ncbi:MAG: DNA polymerase III subunit alpha, partial [Solobacterium sp.]|nr:DNA polymerase III subunit alpha [Solobacterium sp.]
YLMDEEEMKKYYAEEDLLQTKEIIDSCYSHYVFEQSNLPKPTFVGQADSKQYLQKLCEIGLKKRLNQKINSVYTKRLEKELAVIFQKHFEDYFLIVYDMIRFAKKEKDILVGSGRGSATGSLVSYCLGITNIDPIEHNLLFERFLNAQRTSMPDIDIDIQSNRADELFHYLKEKYGEEYVCNSIAFTTFKVKSALQQASKCYRVNEDLFKRLTRAMVPSLTNQENPKLIDYLRIKEVKDVLMQYPILQKIYDAAMQIEDLPQAYVITSQSAVISDRKVEDVVPLLMDKDMIVSQYAKDYLEQFGLIKMDLLKVTTLDLLDAMRKEILKIEPSFQYEKIPDNDELVFAEFSRGETSGIFQLNKEANKRILRLVKPNHFSELANVLALIRPAVKGLVDQYVKNKANPTAIIYPNADFESFMKDTYGVMIYQEQAMLASVYAGGFTLLEADNLRSAFKKKDKETIENMRMRFMDGAKARSLNEVEAGKLFEEIKAFASYGFNKAHAVAYALIAYRLVYIRIHYPLVYYKVRLDEEKQGIDAFIYIEEAKRRGISIRLPHVNEPRIHYEIEGKSLCIPLTRIKNISEKDALAIQEDYEMNGPYSSYFDFVARILLYPGFDETTIENLIYAGALDGFGFNRETMAHNIHAVLQYANLTHILVDGKKVINKNLVTEPMLTKIVMDKQNTTLKQKEVLGFVLDEDLLISMRKEKGITVPRLIEIKDVYHPMIKGFARVDDIYLFQRKYNETMASLTIADETYSLKLSLLPEQYRSLKDTLRNGVYILFDGKIEKENMIYARKIKVLE